MNTRKPLLVQVIKVLGAKQADQSTVPPGSYDVVELPNGKYRLESEDSVYEVEAAWLRNVTQHAKAAIYSKWV